MTVIIQIERPKAVAPVEVNRNSNPGPVKQVLEKLEAHASEAEEINVDEKLVYFAMRIIATAGKTNTMMYDACSQ
jgi:hypothetical protein